MSEQQDQDSKTEEPTSKRLEEARQKGQVASSREVNNALSIAGALAIVTWFLPGIVDRLAARLSVYIANAHQIVVAEGGVHGLLKQAALDALSAVWLPLLILLFLGVLASGLQSGFNVTFEPLKPKLDKLNPVTGLQKYLKPTQQLMELAKSIGKVTVVCIAAYIVLDPVFRSVELFTGMEVVFMLGEIRDKIFLLLLIVLIILAVIAAADYAYTLNEHQKKLKMTKQEVKDENKQSEGDPQVKAKLRQLRIEKVRRRMMANVPRADVVVTNPTHYAVAMKYDPDGPGAPVVLAKGVDFVALRIREVAEEHKIPIVRNPPLARTLYDAVEIDQEIRPEHYRAVAEIIGYIFRLKGRPAKVS